MDDSDTEAEDICSDITIEDVDESNLAIVPKFKLDLDCNNVKPRLDNENGWISMRNDF